MKRHPFIFGFLAVVFVCVGLVGWNFISLLIHLSQQSQYSRLHQSDVDIIVSPIATAGKPPMDCPPEYTNVLSNTNLFTPDEQKLLKAIPLLYGNITPTSGPPGSVLVHLDWFRMWLNGGKVRFQFTNSDMRDDMAFNPFGQAGIHYVRNKAGDGYDINFIGGSGFVGPGPEFQLTQYKHGVQDGLWVAMHDDHCMRWMRFSNSLAVDQWLLWEPNGDKLSIWVKFKAPYPASRSGFGFP